MIKNVIVACILISFLMPLQADQSLQGKSSISYQVAKYKVKKKKRKKKTIRKKTRRKRRKSRRRRRNSAAKKEFIEAMNFVKAGNYEQASLRLFKLVNSPSYRDRRLQLRYVLGLMLYQMGLNQVSAFQFIHVIKRGRSSYLRQSIEKLSLAANSLGDDTLLNYAISKVSVRDFPKAHRDMLLYRIGEQQLRAGKYSEAIRSFKRVPVNSQFYAKSKYEEGLAYSYLKRPNQALKSFNELLVSREEKSVTDTVKVAAKMAKARVYYQARDWSRAISAYRDIPRDTDFWHDTMFEGSWAMLQSGRFRSALSNFQSLHSVYYENFYLPESLILRAIVYLYICKHSEMEKVLNLFNKTYRPMYRDVKSYLKYVGQSSKYYQDVEDAIDNNFSRGKGKYILPKQVLRKVSREGDFKRSRRYIQKLRNEVASIKSRSKDWQNSSIGRYSLKVINTRISKAKKKAGRQVREHLVSVKSELVDLFEQEGFVRVEQINSKREAIKKRVAGKDLPEAQVDDNKDRDFYIQNGYEYWPFRGEYWLDELGNYHYVGTHSCN